ncbi:hypothetical protein RUM44_010894 [Polyplax serrata]|uniref:Uncharacterized protein n=1 Tax=Polyplax serrata TaxID=468196 RepID=A0ABR1ANJ0_POLSC
MLRVILLFSYASEILSQFDFINLNECKLTPEGTEYMGTLSKTKSNVTCLEWNSMTEQFVENLPDHLFPDGSRVSARNFCRNPTKDRNGPWCYTKLKSRPSSAVCDVPFCKNTECRVSGPGMEFAGSIESSISGKKCLQWVEKKNIFTFAKQIKMINKAFPDGTLTAAGRKCRNPDGKISGPWCYVETNETKYNTELCDVPFCDDTGTVAYSEGSSSGQYFFFSSLPSGGYFNISVRLWNPAEWNEGQVFLYLGVYDIPLDRHDNNKWNSGIEILIGNSGSGIVSQEDASQTLADTPFILSGAKWTNLCVQWVFTELNILVKIFESSSYEPFTTALIPIKGTIFEFESFRFFSLGGSPSIWSTEMDYLEECFVHTVSQLSYTRFWLLKKNTAGAFLDFFVKSKQNSTIVFRSAPMVEFHQVEIQLVNQSKMCIVVYNDDNLPIEIGDVNCSNLIDFMEWKYFRISLTKSTLAVFWNSRDAMELLIEINHPYIAGVLWAGFASPRVSYWAIYCDPRGIPPPALLDCNSQGLGRFVGTVSVTSEGGQCLPWTDESSIPNEYHDYALFQPYGGKIACENFCRNLDNDPNGPFCIVRDSNSDGGFSKEYCHSQLLEPKTCKDVGTGSDYMGQLNETRSKRGCKPWSSVMDEVIHINDFPDSSVKDASNFCRNPTNSITGCWCYTDDPTVPMDLCAVNDCDRPYECTILATTYMEDILMYILPSWRKKGLTFWLKAWNPDVYEGLIIKMLSIDSSGAYILIIGDEENEKVKLYYRNDYESGKIFTKFILLYAKTLSHLIPSGKWAGYWLRIGNGKIELGYNERETSFFEWKSSNDSYTIKPVFMSYGTIKNHWIGISFKCSECLTEITSSEKENKIYPATFRKGDTLNSNLILNFRGTGSTTITLMWSPDFNRRLAIEIDKMIGNISLVEYNNSSESCVLATNTLTYAYSNKRWTEYIIRYSETYLSVHKGETEVLRWKSSFPLLIYWFSVTVRNGTMVWIANCPPTDIDGEPRDGSWGDWGPWSCSVTCGRGYGKIERKCNKPPPNVFGNDCDGPSTYSGPCNDFPCGEISPGTHTLIRRYLSNQHKAREVEAKERVLLSCNPSLMPLIINEANDLNVTWSHNGFKCSKLKYRIDENFTLTISRAHEKHNGVYLCTAYQGPNSILPRIVLEAVSLVVRKNRPSKKVSQGRSVTLKCNGLALGHVYADLSLRWELNGSVWKEYSIGALEMVPP